MERKKISLKEIGLPKLIMIFITGILLILLSFPNLFGTKSKTEDKPQENSSNTMKNDMNTTSYDTNTYIIEMENKLKTILKKVSGIGDVDVMITLKSSKEQVTLKDSPYTQESLNEVDGEGGSRTNNSVKRDENSVLVTAEDGSVIPYVVQELEPEVEGVVVIAEGGDNPQIIRDIMDAAVVLFDVPVYKVKVMKMSDN